MIRMIRDNDENEGYDDLNDLNDENSGHNQTIHVQCLAQFQPTTNKTTVNIPSLLKHNYHDHHRDYHCYHLDNCYQQNTVNIPSLLKHAENHLLEDREVDNGDNCNFYNIHKQDNGQQPQSSIEAN